MARGSGAVRLRFAVGAGAVRRTPTPPAPALHFFFLFLFLLITAAARAQAPPDPQAPQRLAALFAPAPVPRAIDSVFRYQLKNGEGYAQDFAIDTEASVSPWAGSDAAATRSLAPFASKSDGSVFALWVAGSRNLDNAPVVLLDSEGQASAVLAANLHEFLGLVALGSSLPDTTPASLEDAPDLENFRRFLRTDLSVGAALGPAASAIMARARATNPGLQRWLEGHPPLLRVAARPKGPQSPAPAVKMLSPSTARPGTAPAIVRPVNSASPSPPSPSSGAPRAAPQPTPLPRATPRPTPRPTPQPTPPQ